MPRKITGIRRHGAGFQIYIRVRGTLLTESHPRTATVAILKARRAQLRTDYLRTLPATHARGTLAADIDTYLTTLADRPRLRQARARQLAWWAARFGHRARHSITRPEWLAALADLIATPIAIGTRAGRPRSVSSVTHYRTAMFHLFTSLDGKDAPNPLRDIPPPRAPDPEPRALPYPLIEAIFAAMPDRGQGQRHQARPAHSKTKARLRVAAYVGLPKAQIERLKPEHVTFDDPSVLVLGRRKGKGTRTVRLPLTAQGAEALRHFFAVGAAGPYSASSARMIWWRGIRTMVDRLALIDWRAAKAALDALRAGQARPHDLRHSMLTAVYLASGDIRATQAFALHADSRQTQRYTLAAVDPRLKALAAALRL